MKVLFDQLPRQCIPKNVRAFEERSARLQDMKATF